VSYSRRQFLQVGGAGLGFALARGRWGTLAHAFLPLCEAIPSVAKLLPIDIHAHIFNATDGWWSGTKEQNGNAWQPFSAFPRPPLA
jgi:hypothetical protein